MYSSHFRSLNQKILLSVSSIAIILAIAASIISYFMEFERSRALSATMLDQLLDTVEGTASIAAYSHNQQIADDVIKGLLKNDIVQHVKIISDGGFVLEKAKGEAVLEKEVNRPLYSPFGDGQKIGLIVIQPNTKYNFVEAKYSALFNAVTSIILIGFTTIVILLNVRKNFSQPLTSVSNSLHGIIKGEKKRLAISLPNKNDELGRLITDINELLTSLEEKFNEERQLRQKIEAIEQQLRHIFNSTSAGLFLLNEQGKLLTFNATLTKILNISEIDQNLLVGGFSISSFFNESSQFEALLRRALQSGQLETQDFSLSQSRDSAETWFHCLVSKVVDAKGEVRLEGVLFNVTDRVEHEQAVQYEANHDPLTKLLRRQAALAAFDHHLATTREPKVAVMLMDLDGFKKANDTSWR